MSDATRNIVIIFIVGFSVLGGFLYYLFGADEDGSRTSRGSVPVSPELTEALTGEGAVRCELTNAATGKRINVRVWRGTLRVEKETVLGDAVTILYQGDSLYAWKQGAAEGFSLLLEQLESVGGTIPGYEVRSREEVVQQLRRQSNQCIAANPAESAFTRPTRIRFRDYQTVYREEVFRNDDADAPAPQLRLEDTQGE